MYLPPMVQRKKHVRTNFHSSLVQNDSSVDGHEIPVVCRILFRNPVTNLRADMNGLDLYTVPMDSNDEDDMVFFFPVFRVRSLGRIVTFCTNN